MVWLSNAARLDDILGDLFQLARTRGADGCRVGDSATFRDELASIYVDAQAMWFMGYRGFAKFAKGELSPEHSLLKLFGSEIAQRAARLATEVQGIDSLDFDLPDLPYPESLEAVPWMKRYMQSYAATISAGASEIQRNIIAERMLGLPRR
jgi:alkylation response protein AidB-like acyl-CoA dehydrogenase